MPAATRCAVRWPFAREASAPAAANEHDLAHSTHCPVLQISQLITGGVMLGLADVGRTCCCGRPCVLVVDLSTRWGTGNPLSLRPMQYILASDNAAKGRVGETNAVPHTVQDSQSDIVRLPFEGRTERPKEG